MSLNQFYEVRTHDFQFNKEKANPEMPNIKISRDKI